MAYINDNYLLLKQNNFFTGITTRIESYKQANPDKSVINLSADSPIRPIPAACIDAIRKALDEASFKGLRNIDPWQGYGFLREAISGNEYISKGIEINPDEIFIGGGVKADIGNICDILSSANIVLIPDLADTAYLDSNIIAGRNIKLISIKEENGFVPIPPNFSVDMVYLCSPGGITGVSIDRTVLKKWVDYALVNEALILFDASYEAFIADEDTPRSIYEIEGAERCAVEFRSFSKTAGFTGSGCGFTVLPDKLNVRAADGSDIPIKELWKRRQSAKSGSLPYIIQRGVLAVYTDEGKLQVKENINYYMENARIIRKALEMMGYTVFGGRDAPYIWSKCPKDIKSSDFFDDLLEKSSVVITPGAGFGESGEGFFRISAFATRENIVTAIERMKLLHES